MIIRSNDKSEFATDERCFITELMNSEDTPDMSIAIARVEAGVSTQLHVLDVDEIYYILEGSGEVEIDGKKDTLLPGDMAVIPKSSSQRITNISDNDLRFLCICQPRFHPESYEEKGS